MELVAFYLFATLAVAAALFILFTRNLMYAAFCLFLSLVGVAALYVFAMADFLAVAQIMIYVGGVLVLLVFGIMLTQAKRTGANYVEVENGGQPLRLTMAAVLLVLLIKVIYAADFALAGEYQLQKSTIHTVGIHLMTTHLLSFEIIAVLLLAVLTGTGYMAYNRIKSL